MSLWKVMAICSWKDIALHFTRINAICGFPLLCKGFTSQNFALENDTLLKKIEKATRFADFLKNGF